MATTAPNVVDSDCGGTPPSRSASTIIAARTLHVLTIDGYSDTLKSNVDPSQHLLLSSPFSAGGHTWCIHYCPIGSTEESKDFISIYLVLEDTTADVVSAHVTFSLLDQQGNPVPSHTLTTPLLKFSLQGTLPKGLGYNSFIRRDDLERSGHLKDDCFAIGVHVVVTKEAIPSSITVPPSDMHLYYGDLLLSEERYATDVEFLVGGETFAAHRLVLAARSPVFMVELFGPMKESTTVNKIQIFDMEAQVFRVLLKFIYIDMLPEIDQEDEAAMAQHLLVAADKYGLHRLKMICVEILSNHIDANSVATILVLADKHHCYGLREACFDFLNSSAILSVIVNTSDFQYLIQSCPDILEDISFNIVAPAVSTVVTMQAYHVLKIDGFSGTLQVHRYRSLSSFPFNVGGRSWYICYHPHGKNNISKDFISIYLVLQHDIAEAAMVQATFSLLDQHGKPVPSHSRVTRLLSTSNQDDMANDLGVHVVITKEVPPPPPPIVVVPPSSNMHLHYGDLLSSKRCADVEFLVGGVTFAAHRLVLAVRSPVFVAEHFGPMKEGANINDVVEINDMDAQAFKALLNFIYMDTLLEMDQEEDTTMAQHLLVAADKYGQERLKVICEERLSNHVDADSVATLLVLTDKHNCRRLNKVCIKFFSSPTALAKIIETDEFQYLTQSCPNILEDIISNIVACQLEKAIFSPENEGGKINKVDIRIWPEPWQNSNARCG
uniref:BTB domain-containing protein n=1 Tax=Oryza nivara TaxID=4536 RepID=A0A0E0ISC9_ORYNI